MLVRSLFTSVPVARAVAPPETRFRPDYEVTEAADGRWLMHLPNAVIPLPQKPAWLKNQEAMNAVLDGSSRPVELRAAHDRIYDLASKNYNATTLEFKPEPLRQAVGEYDRQLKDELSRLYKMRLAYETESTHQMGGAMAGSRCSQMRIFNEILGALR
ncbi:MAG: hypothetical protein KC910_16725 [Candidatus Eremiobacteraeota bacterium]|nr:hypothetical protein [Candidatus Eremiobacteraeota bacterium]